MAKADSKSRHNRPAWSVALLLALAVSVWGLHYKLSLYRPAALRARGPAAKLLSQKERPTASAQLEQNLANGRPAASANHSTATHSFVACSLLVQADQLPGRLLSALPDGSRPLLLLAVQPSAPRPPPITV